VGYNRSGTRRKARLKRAKRHEERLQRKAEQNQADAGKGLLAKAKDTVKSAAKAVGGSVGAAVEKVRGKS
jgi:hypothetical protein